MGGPASRRNCQVGGVENNADLFYSASQLHNSKDSCECLSKRELIRRCFSQLDFIAITIC